MKTMTLCAIVAVAGLAAAGGQDKEKLKADLKDSIAGDWVYDDLASGIALAKKSNKPMLIVFR